jgi:hypothetical protein
VEIDKDDDDIMEGEVQNLDRRGWLARPWKYICDSIKLLKLSY